MGKLDFFLYNVVNSFTVQINLENAGEKAQIGLDKFGEMMVLVNANDIYKQTVGITSHVGLHNRGGNLNLT